MRPLAGRRRAAGAVAGMDSDRPLARLAARRQPRQDARRENALPPCDLPARVEEAAGVIVGGPGLPASGAGSGGWQLPDATRRQTRGTQATGLSLALSLALSLVPPASPASAAPGARGERHADATSPFRAVGGALTVGGLPKTRASGLSRQHERHKNAGPDQYVEALEWLHGGDVLVRLELFENPRREPLQAWLDGDQRVLAVHADEAKPTPPPAAAPTGTSAVLLSFGRSSQAPARQILLLSTPLLRLRLTCEDSQHPRASATFAAIRSSLRLLSPAEARR